MTLFFIKKSVDIYDRYKNFNENKNTIKSSIKFTKKWKNTLVILNLLKKLKNI